MQERFILDEFEPMRQGKIARVVQNNIAPPRGIEHHLGFFQRRNIIVEPAHLDSAGRHEPVAEREISRAHAAEFERNHFDLFRLRAKRGEDRVQRAHPAQGPGPCRGDAPAHGFGPRKALDDGGQHLRQDIEGVPALLLDDGDIEFAFFGIPLDFGFRQRGEARALQKALHGGVRRVHARPALFLACVRLAGWQTRYVQGQTPGRGEARGAFV